MALPTGSTALPAQGSNRWSRETSAVVETASRATPAPTLVGAEPFIERGLRVLVTVVCHGVRTAKPRMTRSGDRGPL